MEQRSQKKESAEDNTYFLEPGTIFFSSGKGAVSTVLGNGVAVCIWNKEMNWGGMNHFIYPTTTESSSATAKYGNVGILTLIKIMLEAGGEIKNFAAQIIGGAIPYDDNKNTLGTHNIKIAQTILIKKNIEIISEDVGGHMGRKIIFDISTGHVAVFKVHKVRRGDWYEKTINN